MWDPQCLPVQLYAIPWHWRGSTACSLAALTFMTPMQSWAHADAEPAFAASAQAAGSLVELRGFTRRANIALYTSHAALRPSSSLGSVTQSLADRTLTM